MTQRLKPTAVDRLLGIDPVHEFLHDGLTEPADAAVRSTMVLAILEHLHDTLTDPTTSGKDAYETFVRTVSILNVFLPEGKRR